MTKNVFGLIFACLFAVCAEAQQTQVEKPLTLDGKLLTLTTLSYASTLYDTRSTLSALDRCATRCVEGNPVMRPFVGTTSSAYAFTLGLTTVTTYGTYRLKKKGVRWWWVPMTASTVLHFAAGVHNQKRH
jgi:hypothetical protein